MDLTLLAAVSPIKPLATQNFSLTVPLFPPIPPYLENHTTFRIVSITSNDVFNEIKSQALLQGMHLDQEVRVHNEKKWSYKLKGHTFQQQQLLVFHIAFFQEQDSDAILVEFQRRFGDTFRLFSDWVRSIMSAISCKVIFPNGTKDDRNRLLIHAMSDTWTRELLVCIFDLHSSLVPCVAQSVKHWTSWLRSWKLADMVKQRQFFNQFPLIVQALHRAAYEIILTEGKGMNLKAYRELQSAFGIRVGELDEQKRKVEFNPVCDLEQPLVRYTCPAPNPKRPFNHGLDWQQLQLQYCALCFFASGRGILPLHTWNDYYTDELHQALDMILTGRNFHSSTAISDLARQVKSYFKTSSMTSSAHELD